MRRRFIVTVPDAASPGAHGRLTAAVARISSGRVHDMRDVRGADERTVNLRLRSAEGRGRGAAPDVLASLATALEGVEGAMIQAHDCSHGEDVGGPCRPDEQWPASGRGRGLS